MRLRFPWHAPICAGLLLVAASGCTPATSSQGPSKSAPATSPSEVAKFDSVVVAPMTGTLTFKWGAEPEQVQSISELSTALANEIAKERTQDSVKVVPPRVVLDHGWQSMTTRALAETTQTQTVLVGRADPKTNQIEFQLIEGGSGNLLWGESFHVSRDATISNNVPVIGEQKTIVERVAGQVLKKLGGGK